MKKTTFAEHRAFRIQKIWYLNQCFVILLTRFVVQLKCFGEVLRSILLWVTRVSKISFNCSLLLWKHHWLLEVFLVMWFSLRQTYLSLLISFITRFPIASIILPILLQVVHHLLQVQEDVTFKLQFFSLSFSFIFR